MTTLQIRLFGSGQLCDATGKNSNVRSRKELAALAYLLLEGTQPQSREVVQTLFWPDLDTESARNNLRVSLAHLQALLPAEANGEKLFQASRSEIQFNPASQVWVDVLAFQQLIDETRRHEHSSRNTCAHCQQSLQTAVDLYTAEFLAGLGLADCPAFEEWLFLQRERQHLLAIKAYHDLSAFAEQQGDLEGALTFIQRQIAIDPLREVAYRQQMYILARQGERSQALATFERCRSIIINELGIDLEPETLLLHQQIISDQILPLVKTTPALTTSQADAISPAQTPVPSTLSGVETNTTRYNLPAQLTSFIGREPELAQLQARLQTGEVRLISLVGPGGIGKTRLAVQAASVNQHLFPDGVFFVGLAGVQTVAEIPAVIMAAMGASLGAGGASPREQLLEVLARQKTLLIIDNLEHLIEAVDLLLQILHAAPRVTLLVTTREQLNCQAEDVFWLHGLATPTEGKRNEATPTGVKGVEGSLAEVDLATAGQYAAVRLFCERAYRLQKSFKLTVENCPAVVKICQLVEGMPLALELATTWLADLDPAGLVVAITQNQAILATTQRDLPARHRSMQAVFDYSWQMLSRREQGILSQLALCQGRLSAHIARQLTGASLIDLTGLRYKSLLRIAEAGYYDLHPLIRTFALATLDHAMRAQAEEQLATLYLKQVAEQGAWLDGATPQDALQAIGRELDNVQQAWQWAESHGRRDLLVQGAAGLGGYYTATGRNSECATRFLPLAQRLLAQSAGGDEVSNLLCGYLLDKACHSLIWLGKLTEARSWAQRMVAVAQALANQELVARGFVHWGKALDELGNPSEAVQKYAEALRLARQLPHPRLVGNTLIELSHSLRALGRTGETEAVLLESLQIQRNEGNRLAEQRALLYLSVCKREESDFQADRNYLLQAMELLKLTGNRHVETRLLDALGINYGLVGNYALAVEYHEASRCIAQEIRQPVQESHTLRHKCTAYRKLGNLALAEECGQESLRLALANGLFDEMHCARLYLGLVWLASGNLAAAADAFQQAYDGWRAQDYIRPSEEALVGLATVDLRRGNLPGACERIAPLVPNLLQRVQIGVREPYEMHLACYEILTAVGDRRAKALLATAYNQLQTNVNKVTDKALLRCFWDAPAHRKIRALSEEMG